MNASQTKFSETVAVLGAGLIGRGWAARFLLHGMDVALYDPYAAENLNDNVMRRVEELVLLPGQTASLRPGKLQVCKSLNQALDGATLVQEAVPEALAIKHALYGEIEPLLKPGTIVASSTSGQKLRDLAAGFRDPEPLVLGHPMLPVELMPLVEIMGQAITPASQMQRLEAIYRRAGLTPIQLKREIPGHAINRLQAALWREQVHLALEGVLDMTELDQIVCTALAPRWTMRGPMEQWKVTGGTGAGDAAAFLESYAPFIQEWWDDLGTPRLDAQTRVRLLQLLQTHTPATGKGTDPETADRRLARALLRT